MTDAAADEVDVIRLARAVIPVKAPQAHWVPERPYRPAGPWAKDPFRHQRVLRDEMEESYCGATAQNKYIEHPYRCQLCSQPLTDEEIDGHWCARG